jgi:hypothetical protein
VNPPRQFWFSCAFYLLAAQASALTIQFYEDADNPLNVQSWQGFQTAASLWENEISTQATLNILVGMHDFGADSANVIGQAGTEYRLFDYTQFRQATALRASSSIDYAFLNTLPIGSSYSRLINQTNDTPGPDYYQTWIDTQSQIYLTSGNAKALGLISPTLPVFDAYIEFNSVFAFDYNRTNGISSNQLDFVGVATHEIGHALGFNTIVDYIDMYGGNAADFLSCRSISCATPLRVLPWEFLMFLQGRLQNTFASATRLLRCRPASTSGTATRLHTLRTIIISALWTRLPPMVSS